MTPRQYIGRDVEQAKRIYKFERKFWTADAIKLSNDNGLYYIEYLQYK